MNLIEEDDEPAWTYTYDPEDAEGMDDDEYDPDFQDEPEEEEGDDDDEYHGNGHLPFALSHTETNHAQMPRTARTAT